MYIMNCMCFWIKKKVMEALVYDLCQYKNSQYKHVQNQFIWMNIHMFIAHNIKRNKSKNT